MWCYFGVVVKNGDGAVLQKMSSENTHACTWDRDRSDERVQTTVVINSF